MLYQLINHKQIAPIKNPNAAIKQKKAIHQIIFLSSAHPLENVLSLKIYFQLPALL